LRPDQSRQLYPLTLIFGGALGNYIDRLHYRYVIDFLDFHFHGRHAWPAFNIADMCIVVGIGTLVIQLLLDREQNKVAPAKDPQ
jgi:signal peptidase II